MANSSKSLEFENVNGITLELNIYKRETAPKSTQFTITYKNPIDRNIGNTNSRLNRMPGAKTYLFVSFIINLILCYLAPMSVTSVLILIIVLTTIVVFWLTHTVQSETLLVIPTVCIQSTVKYVWGREDNYVDWSNIDDVIINEVIKMNRVLYYLTILHKSDADSVRLVPLFTHTRPRLFMLQKIYSEIQSFLMESQTESTMGSGDRIE